MPAATGGGGGGGGGSGITVTVSPKNAWVQVGGTLTYSAAVTGTSVGGVTWSVEPAGAGTISTSGVYTAPSQTGGYQIVAQSVADTNVVGSTNVTVVPVQPTTPYVLPDDRATAWKPGVTYNGGIPSRTTVCATVNPGDGVTDDSSRIQSALDACPVGQVVQLAAGTFIVNNYVLISKAITLRGAGAGATILKKANGQQPGVEGAPDQQPIAIIGPNRWPSADSSTSTNLTADGAKGATSVTVSSGSGFAAGQFVLLDEATGGQWMTDPDGRGQVWASSDYRVIWLKHNPAQPWDDFAASDFPYTPGSAGGWFCRLDRPTAEVKEVASVSGNTITFTTPLHISYRTSHTAQLTRYTGANVHVKNAGIENLTAESGSDGGIRFEAAAYSWAKNVENRIWGGEGFAINNSFRVEVRDSYIHDAGWAQPGGAGYAISLANGSAEALVENCISVRANKVMVARSSGAGSVFGYNYVDQGYINTAPAWIEVGLNASHMVGPHHVLFEGNYGFNFDSDQTHGNSIYITAFRNYLRGIRTAFTNQLGGTIDDANQSGNGPRRCIGSMGGSYWMSFVGNVLGAPGQMSGWVYETTFIDGTPGIYMLGWDAGVPYPTDSQVAATALRDGNFDWLTGQQRWHGIGGAVGQGMPGLLPDSLYLSAKPTFFGASTWPWVNPVTGAVGTLPAKARYDAGTPNVVP